MHIRLSPLDELVIREYLTKQNGSLEEKAAPIDKDKLLSELLQKVVGVQDHQSRPSGNAAVEIQCGPKFDSGKSSSDESTVQEAVDQWADDFAEQFMRGINGDDPNCPANSERAAIVTQAGTTTLPARQSTSISQTDDFILTVPGGTFRIPAHTAKLLFISEDDPADALYGHGVRLGLDPATGRFTEQELPRTEPSMIFVRSEVRKPKHPWQVAVPVMPAYASLSPAQRWLYLDWLGDVTSEIGIGYVFLYYYGLERQLLSENFDAAFEELLLLRQAHSHPSFHRYSLDALLLSSLHHKRKDCIERLYAEKRPFDIGENELRLLQTLGIDLSARSVAQLGLKLAGNHRRYIKSHRELFERTLTDVLIRRFSQPCFPFAGKYPLDDVTRGCHVTFANFSLDEEIRVPILPSFFDHRPFVRKVEKILGETHELIKAALKAERLTKRKSANLLPEG